MESWPQWRANRFWASFGNSWRWRTDASGSWIITWYESTLNQNAMFDPKVRLKQHLSVCSVDGWSSLSCHGGQLHHGTACHHWTDFIQREDSWELQKKHLEWNVSPVFKVRTHKSNSATSRFQTGPAITHVKWCFDPSAGPCSRYHTLVLCCCQTAHFSESQNSWENVLLDQKPVCPIAGYCEI